MTELRKSFHGELAEVHAELLRIGAQAITSSRGRSSGVGGLCRKCSKSVMGFTALPAPEYQRPDSRPAR